MITDYNKHSIKADPNCPNTYFLAVESLVADVHQLLKNRQFNQAIGVFENIKDDLVLSQLPFNAKGFTRVILSTKDNYWLSVINWSKGHISNIHGHPKEAFYYLIHGALREQNYSHPPLTESELKTVKSGEYRCTRGTKNTFDNAIHRIEALQKTLSLHFYSDDARLGKVFP